MLSPLVASHTFILPLLNGMGHSERLRQAFPSAKVLHGCVYVNSNISEPGTIVQYGSFDQFIFGTDGEGNIGADELIALETIFKDAGFNVSLDDHIIKRLWEKLFLIGPSSTVTSFIGQPFGAMLGNPEHRDLLVRALEELKDVAAAKKAPVDSDIIQRVLKKMAKFLYETKTSMQLDFENNRKTEVEVMPGFVVREAEQLGLDVPTTRMMYEKLRLR